MLETYYPYVVPGQRRVYTHNTTKEKYGEYSTNVIKYVTI